MGRTRSAIAAVGLLAFIAALLVLPPGRRGAAPADRPAKSPAGPPPGAVRRTRHAVPRRPPRAPVTRAPDGAAAEEGGESVERTSPCAIVGRVPEGVPGDRTVVRLFRPAEPAEARSVTWDQERWTVVQATGTRFVFRDVSPGPKLVTARFERHEGVVAFAGAQGQAVAGETRDVGLLAPVGGGRVEVRLDVRDARGMRTTLGALAGGDAELRFAAFVSTVEPLPDVDDVTERVVFDDDGRVVLEGLPPVLAVITGLELLPPARRRFAVSAPARVEIRPGDGAVEIPVRLATSTAVELEIPVTVTDVDAFSSACVSTAWPVRTLSVSGVRPSAVVVAGTLVEGRWRVVGSVACAGRGWCFDQVLDVGEVSIHETLPVSEAAWVEGGSPAGAPAPVLFLAPADLAGLDVWPFRGAAPAGRRVRVAVPAHTRLVSMGSEASVTSRAPGETVVKE